VTSPTTRTPRETSGTTTRLILAYVRTHLGEAAVAELLELAGEHRPAAELEDERTWSSYATKLALFEAAAALTGHHDIGRRVGAAVLAHEVAGPVRRVLVALGSPSQVLRRVALATPKFTTTATMATQHVGPTGGHVTYRLHEGYPPSRFDCDYTQGLLSQVPAVFGLPAAEVAHDTCQIDGADACVYEVRWERRNRFSRRRFEQRHDDAQRLGLDELQQALEDLVSIQDLDTLLARVVARASSAVRGEHYVLAVRVAGESTPRIHAEGLDPVRAALIGERALQDPHDDDPSRIVVDVASSRHHYGHLVAGLPSGSAFFDHERRLLASYARLAAAALDGAVAIGQAVASQRSANGLLALAERLACADGERAIWEIMATTTPDAVGADRALVLRRQRGGGFVVAASCGWLVEQAARLDELRVELGDTDRLTALLAAPGSRLYTRERCDDPFVSTLMERFGTRAIAVMPLTLGSSVTALVVAAWSEQGPAPRLDEELLARLSGVVDQGMVALGRARLRGQLEERAGRDAITGLPSRSAFEELVEAATTVALRDQDWFTVAMVDIDRFASVNDVLGRKAGDRLLTEIADRLARRLPVGATLARDDADRFLVLAPRAGSAAEAQTLSAQLREVFATPFVILGHDLVVTASIGAVGASAQDRGPTDVLARARAAMRQVKAIGGNGSHIGDAGGGPDLERLALESQLHRAIEQGQLRVDYQPQTDLATGRVSGVEALVRWQHPSRGLLGPAAFLPVAEETGLIVDVDLAVLRIACDQVAAWRRRGLDVPRVAVNLSGRTFCDPRLLPALQQVLTETALPPTALEIELTEEQLPDLDRAALVAAEVASLGCSLAIDDLGRGQSSLGWLHRLPVTRLKVDRSFVADIGTPRAGEAIVAGLIAMGRELRCSVLVEGVETDVQLAFVRERGATEMQGYLHARPMAPEACADHLTARSRATSEALRAVGV
jgi:diguanylate cyclase (GGDEF)-like protein